MKLEDFGALIKANELFDNVVGDMNMLKGEFGCQRLVERNYCSKTEDVR